MDASLYLASLQYLSNVKYPSHRKLDILDSVITKYKYKNTVCQTKRENIARHSLLKLWKKINPAFTVKFNTANKPMLVCEAGVLKCNVYFDKNNYMCNDYGIHIVKLECNDDVKKSFINTSEVLHEKHTYNKHKYYYAYDYVSIRRLAK